MGIAPARMWLAAAVVVGLLAAAVAWNARGSQLGGPVSALEVEPVPKEAAEDPQEALPATALRKAPAEEGRAASAPSVEPAAAPGEAVSKVVEPPSDDAAPDSDMKQAAREQNLRGGLHIGGHSRLMDSFIGVVDVDESDVAKTINVHILRDQRLPLLLRPGLPDRAGRREGHVRRQQHALHAGRVLVTQLRPRGQRGPEEPAGRRSPRDIKLLAGDIKIVVVTVPADEPSLYMFSRVWEKQGMAETLGIVE